VYRYFFTYDIAGVASSTTELSLTAEVKGDADLRNVAQFIERDRSLRPGSVTILSYRFLAHS
jgi:hypothetical protein